MTTETFTKRMPFEFVETSFGKIRMMFRVGSTIREFVILVSFLGIGIWANLVGGGVMYVCM